MKIAAFGVLAAIFAVVLRKQAGEFALLVSLLAILLLFFTIASELRTLLGFFAGLQQITNLKKELITPLLKTVGIGYLTRFTADVCKDAGEQAIAGAIETCGCITAVCATLPLLKTTLELFESLLSGG